MKWVVEFFIPAKRIKKKVQPERKKVLEYVKKVLTYGEDRVENRLNMETMLRRDLRIMLKETGGGRPKKKGREYEKKIGKILGEWWWGKPFRHTPGSGAWDKQAKDGQQLAFGDLVIPEESKCPFSVECKKTAKEINIFNASCVLFSKDWWPKCSQDALNNKRIPILVFGANNKSDYVAYSKDDLITVSARHIDVYDTPLEGCKINIYILSVVLLSDFIRVFPKGDFIE